MSVTVEEIGPAESWRIFDAAARARLGISGEVFVRRWDAGAYDADEDPDVMQVAMLRPSGPAASGVGTGDVARPSADG